MHEDQSAPDEAHPGDNLGADSRRVVRAVEGVRNVAIRFEDHYTGDEINSALNDGAGFMGAFPGETEDDFACTLDVVAEARFAGAFTFRWFARCTAFIDGRMAAAIQSDRVVPECRWVGCEVSSAVTPRAP